MLNKGVELVPPTQDHIDELVANLRADDLAECQAGGVGPRDAIEVGVRESPLCWAALLDGQLAAIVGVRPAGSLLTDLGCVWLLGTPLIAKHPRAFAATTRAYIPVMLNAYPHLANFVHAENAPAVRWLRRAGFTLHDPVPYGPKGALFHPFEMKAANV